MTDALLDIKPLRDELGFTYLNVMLAIQIKAMRDARGWAQQELAERAELNVSEVGRLEQVRWDHIPHVSTLRAIARAFDVALIIRFESWSELVHEFLGDGGINPALCYESLAVRSFADDPGFELEPSAPADSSTPSPQHQTTKKENL